jgi:iron(III) transport system permease protein
MVTPALLYCGLMVFFAGITMFGLPLILGGSSNTEMLSVYLYKLTNRFSYPSYQLIAAVAAFIIFMTLPLIFLQRSVLKMRQKYVTIGGKGGRQRLIALGVWRWPAFAAVMVWLLVTVIVPVSGIVLRAFVIRWGPTVNLLQVLTLKHFVEVYSDSAMLRAIWNTVLIGIVGGGLAVACYTIVGLAVHRRHDGWARVLDYLVLAPHAVPGLLIGLAFLWVFLFVGPLSPLRPTPFSIWLAYTVVWFAYGMRLISGALFQIAPELEESARTIGASRGRTLRDVILPLLGYALLASWLLIFLAFESEYSAGVYLMSVGNETIGALLVVFADGGSDRGTVAALAVVNLALIGVGLAIALRWGVKVRE